MKFAHALLVAGAMIAAPLYAQAAPSPANQTVDSPPKTDPAHLAADAREKPETRALNNAVDENLETVKAANEISAANFETDKAAYLAALRAHRQDVNETDATFVRQQAAYAQAMADWRVQVAACTSGKARACDIPTPNPSNYM
jgi:hypothetical protein